MCWGHIKIWLNMNRASTFQQQNPPLTIKTWLEMRMTSSDGISNTTVVCGAWHIATYVLFMSLCPSIAWSGS